MLVVIFRWSWVPPWGFTEVRIEEVPWVPSIMTL